MTDKVKVEPPPVRRISGNEYMDLVTGEICEYNHIDTRMDSVKGIRRTLARIRALVNTNVYAPSMVRWVTLTYADNMQDGKKLCRDFDVFRKRLNRYCVSHEYGKPEYISVIEPQARGAWHIHAFFIWPVAPYIPNVDLAMLWGHGFVSIKQPQSCDNMGAYFSAYLADIPVDEAPDLHGEIVEKEFIDDRDGATKRKKFIKGGRLSMYPPKFNIVRHSRGIKEPEVEMCEYAEARKKVHAHAQTFTRTYVVRDDETGRILNTITRTYYNGVRWGVKHHLADK